MVIGNGGGRWRVIVGICYMVKKLRWIWYWVKRQALLSCKMDSIPYIFPEFVFVISLRWSGGACGKRRRWWRRGRFVIWHFTLTILWDRIAEWGGERILHNQKGRGSGGITMMIKIILKSRLFFNLNFPYKSVLPFAEQSFLFFNFKNDLIKFCFTTVF